MINIDELSAFELVQLAKKELDKTKEYVKDAEYNSALARKRIEDLENLIRKLSKKVWTK